VILAKQVRFGVLAAAVVLLPGCQSVGPATSGERASASGSGTGTDLAAASTGVCKALAALPDTKAAERSFENVAHAALHALAAAPTLDRALSAAVLESMERVEADFTTSGAGGRLRQDLEALLEDTNMALQAIGQAPLPCE
jgi:hypothetical protein